MAKQVLIAVAIALCMSMISAQNAAEFEALLGVADIASPTVTLGETLENSQITGLASAVSPPCLSVSTGDVGVLFKKAAKGLKPKKCNAGTNCIQFVACKSPTGQLNCYQPVSCKATDTTKCRVLRPCTSTDCNGQFKFVPDVAGFKFKSNPISGSVEIRKCPTGCLDIKRCTSTVFAPNPDCYDFQPCVSTTGAPSCLRIVECQETATSTTPFVSTTTAPVVTTTTAPVVTAAPCNPKIQVVKSNSGYSLVDGNNGGVRFQQCATGSPCGEYINCPDGANCLVKKDGCKSSTLSCLNDIPCCANAFQLDPVNNGITLVKVEVDGLTTVPCPGNDKCFQLRDCKVSKDPATGAIIPCLAKRDCTSNNKSCFQLNPCA